jgi:hypothetical protein
MNDRPTLPTVLYISGWCRNGSTLIGNLLNEIDGYFHTGELHYLWRNALGAGTNQVCGCGAALTDCSVWSEVLADGAGAPTAAAAADWRDHAHQVVSRQRAVRTRHTWSILNAPELPPERAAYARDLARAYRAAASALGARVIVDGGKYPSEAALLRRSGELDVKLLHLVRDPRAIANSWARDKDYISRMSAARSTAYWVGFNFATEAVARRYGADAMFLRYEDFIAAPEETLDAVVRHLGDGAAGNPVSGRDAVLRGNHTVSGNPDRRHVGPVEITSSDTAKIRSMPRLRRAAAAGIAAPRFHRYGYTYAT